MSEPSHQGLKLDFLELFQLDASRGAPRALEFYRDRFPELAGWIEGEHARLVAELEARSELDSTLATDALEDSSLLHHLQSKRGMIKQRDQQKDHEDRGGEESRSQHGEHPSDSCRLGTT